jgi:hypothetical protein
MCAPPPPPSRCPPGYKALCSENIGRRPARRARTTGPSGSRVRLLFVFARRAEETSRCCMRNETYETNDSFFRPWAHHFFFALIGYCMVRVFPHTALSWHKAPNELARRSWLSKKRPEYGRLGKFSSPPVVRSRAQAQLGSQAKMLAPAQSCSYWPRYVVREQSIIRSRFHLLFHLFSHILGKNTGSIVVCKKYCRLGATVQTWSITSALARSIKGPPLDDDAHGALLRWCAFFQTNPIEFNRSIRSGDNFPCFRL